MLGIYTRLSVQDDASNSIENQKREGIAFAKENKLPYRIYDEGEGVSGRNEITDRPQLDQLLKDIVSKEITHVWFRNQNRLERNSNTFHLFANQVKKSNVKVYFDSKLEDWEDPSSFLKSSILTSLNEYQASLQSHQTKKALLDNVKEGKSFGVYPYGYKSDENGFLVVDEEEKEIVELIYELSLSGKGTRSIAEYLNDKNIPTRYNKIGTGTLTVKDRYTKKETVIEKKKIKWSGNSVRGIIINTIYKGDRKWQGEIFKAPPIFDPVYWKKVNVNLKNNRNNTGKKVEHKYLLKGILECGKCGRNMYGRTRVSKKDHYYMCSSKRFKDLNCGNRSINIDFIEKFLWEVVLEDAYVIDELEKENKEDNIIEQLNENKKEILKQLSVLNKEITKINQLAIEGLFNVSEAIREKESRNKKINELQLMLDNLNDEIEFELKAIELRKTAGFDIDKVRVDTPFNRRKELISKYIKRVFIRYDESIKFYYIAVKFNTKTGQQNYAFSSNPHRMKKFIQTGDYEITDEEKELIVNGVEIDNNSLNDYIENYTSARKRINSRK